MDHHRGTCYGRQLSRRRHLTVLCLGGVFLAHAATAATYYVAPAPTGSNSNPGTQEKPFETIAKGLSVTFAGDTLYIRAGTYSAHFRSYVETIHSGTSWSNSVTIAGYPGEIPTVQGGIDISLGSGVQYVIFQNLKLDASRVNNNGVFIGSDFIRLRNMEILYYPGPPPEGPNNGIQNYGNHNEFIALKIHPSVNQNLTRTHGLYAEGAFNLYDGIESYDNGGYGLQAHNGKDNTAAHDNTVRNCRLHDNGGSKRPVD
jgi:hypothetical protein